MGILYGASGCLLVKAGISRLSELAIDADKDWGGHAVTGLSHLAEGMARGSLLVHDGERLVALPGGSIGHELTACDETALPAWQAPPGE